MLQHAFSAEAGTGTIFLRVRALEQKPKDRVRTLPYRHHLIVADHFLLDPDHAALPSHDLYRGGRHVQGELAMVAEVGIAALMIIDGARRNPERSAGIEDTARLPKRFQKLLLAQVGKGVVAGTLRGFGTIVHNLPRHLRLAYLGRKVPVRIICFVSHNCSSLEVERVIAY
jgi:hypothetical protein